MERIVQRLVRDELRFRWKLVVLEYARECGSNTKAWREFEMPKSTFYLWKKAYDREGRAGLKRKKPVAHTHPKRIPPQVIELHLHRVAADGDCVRPEFDGDAAFGCKVSGVGREPIADVDHSVERDCLAKPDCLFEKRSE